MGTVVETSTSYTVETIPGGEPLGLENGGIPDDHITASTSAGPAPPHLARLNGLSSWCAGKAEDSFLQVNLGSLHLLCAVATQGNPGGNRDYVKRYRLMSSTDGETWTTYEENGNDIIEGNTDNSGVKKKELEKEIITRYVRICPVDWYCWPCLRVELYGAALNIGDKFPNIQSDDGGNYVVEKVLVTTYETHVDEDGVPDEDSVKEQEKKIIRDAKERQRIEEDQQNRLEEIQIFIEQEEGKRKPSVEDMDFDERKEAEARIQLVLNEERTLERREKPDGEDVAQRDVEEVKHDRVTKEYNRIDEEHRKRMEALTAILGEDEERRRKEKEERRKAEEDARKKREEERRAKEEELKRKREEERQKWDEEHRKWEEERKKRDQELEALLEEGRKKRAEERKKRDEELRKMREDDKRKREDERKKRMEEEMKKLDELRKEREERWNKKTEVVISGIDLEVKENKEDNRQDEKKKKEEGWIKRVETPRMVEEEMKKFRDEERKRLEEERKKLKDKELADAEAQKELKSELRVLRQEQPETITRVSVATIQLATPQDTGEEKRRLEWRMQKIEQDRLLRKEEERKKREEAERKKKEGEERAKEEEQRRRREQEEERERRKEELRLKREAEERQKREEEERERQEEDARRRMTLEERRKRLEEDKKKREDEERIWRRAMEERKQREEEEKRKEEESKRRKRLSIDRKKFEEEEKKRLDEIERQRLEQEEKERLEEDRRRREERERWKLKQAERRRSGEIYRHKSEEDLRKREERYSFKEKQRKQRDSKSFEVKWEFINGERVAVPVDESLVSATSDTSYSEPPEVFDDETPDTSFVTVNAVETRITPSTDEKDSSRVTSTIRVITSTTTRTRYHASHDHHPRADSEETSLNGEVVPYRSQPRCDHLLPTDSSVQEAEEMSFFDKFEENEGKLRPFPSWYGGLDMGSLPHLYLPSNPIQDSDIDHLLSIENEGLKSWKRIKKSGELEIYSRKGRERGSPPVNKAVMVLKDISYRDAIDLVSDWDERSKWDKTFDGVSFLDQMADFKLLKCSQKKKNRCVVLASLDREDEEPYYAWAWKGSNHPSVPGEDSKLTVMRLETGICGAIIRPYHDATRSCKITIITQVRGSVPSPLKSTYLTGNPSKWLIWMKKHHNSQVKSTMETEQDDDKNKDDASSVSSKSDKQD